MQVQQHCGCCATCVCVVRIAGAVQKLSTAAAHAVTDAFLAPTSAVTLLLVLCITALMTAYTCRRASSMLFMCMSASGSTAVTAAPSWAPLTAVEHSAAADDVMATHACLATAAQHSSVEPICSAGKTSATSSARMMG
eukprot:11751-Heterococcus_DN1.PRE.4